MDAIRKQSFPALLAGTCLMFAAAFSADADVRIAATRNGNITFQGDDVVITADDGSRARISPEGDLTLAGKPVAVDDGQRRLLQQYSDGAHELVRHGMKLGTAGAQLAVDIVGAVFSGLLAGDDDKEIERRTKASTAGFKAKARVLCDDMQSLVAHSGPTPSSAAPTWTAATTASTKTKTRIEPCKTPRSSASSGSPPNGA